MEKFSVFAMLYKHRANANGEVPVTICVTLKNKPVAYDPLNRRVKLDDWNPEKQLSRSDKLLNALILKRKTDLVQQFNMLELAGQKITVLMIKRVIAGTVGIREIKPFTEDLLRSWKGKKSDETIRIYQTELNKLVEHAGSHISFDDIDQVFLRKYELHLREKGNENNTIFKAWKCMKKIFNDARREEIIKDSPFDKYDNPTYEQTDRTYLEEMEVNAIEDLLLQQHDPVVEITTLFFLLGCYSGLRVSDWINFKEAKYVVNGRLVLRTKKNGEIVSMKISSQLRTVLDKINNRPLGLDRHACNRYLKVIGASAGLTKVLTNHVSRHSFAVRCAELGISIETTANLMGITVDSCKYYYRVTNRKTDTEMDKWETLRGGTNKTTAAVIPLIKPNAAGEVNA